MLNFCHFELNKVKKYEEVLFLKAPIGRKKKLILLAQILKDHEEKLFFTNSKYNFCKTNGLSKKLDALTVCEHFFLLKFWPQKAKDKEDLFFLSRIDLKN